MKAFISSSISDGNSRIEFVDEYGNRIDIYEVSEIHVEVKRENIEPLHRAHKPQLLKTGRFYAN